MPFRLAAAVIQLQMKGKSINRLRRSRRKFCPASFSVQNPYQSFLNTFMYTVVKVLFFCSEKVQLKLTLKRKRKLLFGFPSFRHNIMQLITISPPTNKPMMDKWGPVVGFLTAVASISGVVSCFLCWEKHKQFAYEIVNTLPVLHGQSSPAAL